eukprot:2659118-Amphidinium_carterae.1
MMFKMLRAHMTYEAVCEAVGRNGQEPSRNKETYTYAAYSNWALQYRKRLIQHGNPVMLASSESGLSEAMVM